MKKNIYKIFPAIILITTTLLLISYWISHAKTTESLEETENYSTSNNSNNNYTPKTKIKPKFYLENATAYVETAGAGFRMTEACVYVDTKLKRDIGVWVRAYANGEKVGETLIYIEKGETQGCERFRLDGFMGWFEEDIPYTVTLVLKEPNLRSYHY